MTIRSRGGTSNTSTSSIGYYGLRKSRILIFSLLYHSQHQTLHYVPLLRTLVFLVEMLQVLSLALEPAFTSFGNSGIDEGIRNFARIRMPMPALAYSGAHTAALTVLIIYLCLVLLSGAKLAFMEEGTKPPPPFWLRVWGVASLVFHPILYLPALSILFSAMHCGIVHFTGGDPYDSLSGVRNTFSEEGNIQDKLCAEGQSLIFIILTAIFLVITIFMFGLFAFAEYGFEQNRKSKFNLFSHTVSRLSLYLFLIKTIATLFTQFTGPVTLLTRSGLYHWGLIICFGVLVAHVCVYLPYYRRVANVLYASFFLICFMGTICAFAASRSSHKIDSFIAFMVLIVPLIGLAFFFCWLRWRKYYTPAALRENYELELYYPFEVELMSRPIISSSSHEKILNIFWRGLAKFPNSLTVQLTCMQFLAEDRNHFQLLTGAMEKVRKHKRYMAWDMKFLLHCIEKDRMSIALAMDGGVEEISKSLLSANHHALRAKLLVKNFWESLLHEEDLMLMPNMVAKLEHEESTADKSFRKLRERFPNNVAVMRHYATFLEEVKGHPDAASDLYKLAEETEQASHHVEETVSEAMGLTSDRPAGPEDLEAGRGKEKEKEKEKEKDKDFFEVNVSSGKQKLRMRKLTLEPGKSEEKNTRPSSPMRSPAHAASSARSVDFLPVSEDGQPLVPTKSKRKMTKYEIQRQRQYRDQAEVFKSHSVWKVSSAINLTMLLMLMNIVFLFAATLTLLNSQTNSINQLNDMSDTRHNVATSISSVLRGISNAGTNMSKFNTNMGILRTSIDFLANQSLDLYTNQEKYEPVRKGWTYNPFPVAEWSYVRQEVIGDGYIYQNRTTLDMLTGFTFWIEQTFGIITTDNGTNILWNTTAGRWIIENGLMSLTDGVVRLVDLYDQKARFTVTILQAITISLLSFSFVVIASILWFLVRSAIREIQSERLEILKLFLQIPKDNILSIMHSFKEPTEEEEELFAANEDEYSSFNSTVDLRGGYQRTKEHFATSTVLMAKNSRLSMLRNFFLKFLLCLTAGLLLVVVASGIILAAVPVFNENIRSINVAGQRRTYASHLHSSTMTLAYYSEITRAFPEFNATMDMHLTPAMLRRTIADDVDKVRQTDSILKYGLNGAAGIQHHPAIVEMEFNSPCQPVSGYTYTCTGINSVIVFTLTLAEIIMVIPYSQLGFATSQVAQLSAIAYAQLDRLLGEASTYYRDSAAEKVDDVRSSVIIIFALIFPVLIGINFVLRPMVEKVKLEHKRTLRMLLMIPMYVIDSTPAIREYLDSLAKRQHKLPWYKTFIGKSIPKLKQKHKKRSRNEQLLDTHEPLLQAFARNADEALIVVSMEGTVEIISPSAQRILGYERQHLVGRSIESVFDPKSMQIVMNHFVELRHDPEAVIRDTDVALQGKRSSGFLFPIGVTISMVRMNSKAYFGVYVRDLSYMRELELQIDKEREVAAREHTKVQELLLNMFPATIADQLLKMEGDTKSQYFAEEYKETTVLFADMVGFTQMCAGMEPTEVLQVLDGLFAEWDTLVSKYSLQKIRTVGDCYMVAGGVPDRAADHVERVIDFALDLISTLYRYNESCVILKSRSISLNARVGINTGPVVGGVVGRSRRCFDLWGEAVNIASRMEYTSAEGRVQVSQSTFNRVKNNYLFEERGTIETGKGSMLTYLLVAPRFVRSGSGRVIDNRFAPHLGGLITPKTPVKLTPEIRTPIEGETRTESKTGSLITPRTPAKLIPEIRTPTEEVRESRTENRLSSRPLSSTFARMTSWSQDNPDPLHRL